MRGKDERGRAASRRLGLAALILTTTGTGVVLSGVLQAGASVTRYELDVRVRGSSGDGANEIKFDGQRYGDVSKALANVVFGPPTTTVAGATSTTTGGSTTSTTAAPPALVTLAIGPDGFADVVVEGAEILLGEPRSGPGPYTMTFRGDTQDFLDRPSEMLATAKWKNVDDDNPELSVLFRFEDVTLATFELGFTDLDVEFSDAWVAVSRNAGPDTKVVPADFPEVDDFFDDGIAGTDDAFSVATTFLPLEVLPPDTPPSEGVVFRGVADDQGLVADAASQLGLAREIRIDGTISMGAIYHETCPVAQNGSFTCSEPSGSRPVSAVGVELIAEFQPATTSTLPQQIALDAGWVLAVSGNSAGIIEASIEGSAAVELIPNEMINLGGRLSFTRSSQQGYTFVDLELKGENLQFSQELVLREASIAFGMTAATRSASGSPPTDDQVGRITGTALVDLDPLFGVAATAELQLQVAGGTTGSAVTFSGDIKPGNAGVDGLLGAFGVSAPPLGIDLDQFGFALSLVTGTVDGAGGSGTSTTTGTPTTSTTAPSTQRGTRLVVTLTAQTSVALTATKEMNADLLVIVSKPLGGGGGGGGATQPATDFLVVAKPGSGSASNINVSDLGPGGLAFDFELPEFFLSVASRTWEEKPDFLNPAVEAFVETQDGRFRDKLFYREGVSLKADLDLQGDLAGALTALGIKTDRKLRLNASLPLFGSAQWGLEIVTPEIVPTEPGPFRSGQFRLLMGSFWVDAQQGGDKTNRTEFQLGLVADVKVAVRHETDPDCADSTDYAGTSCFDQLEFKVAGLITVGTSGLSVVLEGSMVGDGWLDPLGLEGVTIDSLALSVAVDVPTVGTPGVTVGLGGGLQIGNRTFSLSFLLRITPTPPWLNPLGFTFATNRVELHDVVELYNAFAEVDVDPDALNIPDLRLENVYLMYGTVDDPSKCIRMGFFMAAELHIGGSPGGTTPTCDGKGNLPPSDIPDADEACKGSTSCLAAVLVDIQAGTTVSSAVGSKVKIQGYFAGAELGPFKFEEALLDLELSPTNQHFRLSGGSSFTIDGFEVAAGDFLVDIRKGDFYARADVRFFDSGLEAGVEGTASLDFANPKFTLDVYLRAPGLVALAQSVDQAFKDLGKSVSALGVHVGDVIVDTAEDLWREIESVFGKRPAYDPFEGMTRDEIFEFIKGMEPVIERLRAGGFDFLPEDPYEHLLWATRYDGPDIPGTWIYFTGGRLCIGHEIDGECLMNNPDLGFIGPPGLCDDEVRRQDPFCNRDQTYQENLAASVGALFSAEVSASTGLDTSTIASSPAQALEGLYDKMSQGSVAATCARTTIDFTNEGSPVEDTVVRLEVDGSTSEFTVPFHLGAPEMLLASTLFQPGVEGLVDEATDLSCGTGTTDELTEPPVGVVFRASDDPGDPIITRVDEGDVVWAHGTAPEGEVTIDWADGSALETVAVGEDGMWIADHRYEDDGAFDIAIGAGDESTTERFRVANVAPTATATISESAAEGESVSVTVAVDDVGVHDTHTVHVRWGDFTTDAVEVPGSGGGTVTLAHVYADEGTAGTGSGTPAVVVWVVDDDGGSVELHRTLTLSNVEPSVSIEGPGRLVEADAGTWNFTVTDPGTADIQVLTIDWGDGTSEEVALGPSAAGEPTRSISVEHAWADDDPTGTAEDAYLVSVRTDDGDSGTGDGEAGLVVANVAPTVSIEPIGAKSATAPSGAEVPSVDEAEPLQWRVTVTDPGLRDTHVVTLRWGDGSSDTVNLGPPDDESTERSTVVEHTWSDDDPTATAQDLYTVEVAVVDDDTGTGAADSPLIVRNVAPTITSLELSVSGMAENEAVLSVHLAFDDVARADSHTVTVDWGDGWTPGTTADTDVSGQDVGTTVVSVPAVDPSADDAAAAAVRTLSFQNRYGDDSDYTIVVTVVDDDTGTVADSRTLTVDNVTPEHTVDRSAATSTAGGPTWLRQTGETLTLGDSATDPGSDDLRFDWTFGDGASDSEWWLRSGGEFGERTEANADGRPSPQVAPAGATSVVSHAWSRACLYGVSATVSDDDGAAAPTAYGAVAVQRSPDGTGPRNFAQWRSLIDGGGISQADLDCYLDVAGHLSSVLLGRSELDDGSSGGDPTPWSSAVGWVDATARTDRGVPAVLDAVPERAGDKLAQEQVKFDRALLAVWLSYADGAFGWNQVVEGGSSFAAVIAELEEIRRSSSDFKDVMAAWQRLHALG